MSSKDLPSRAASTSAMVAAGIAIAALLAASDVQTSDRETVERTLQDSETLDLPPSEIYPSQEPTIVTEEPTIATAKGADEAYEDRIKALARWQSRVFEANNARRIAVNELSASLPRGIQIRVDEHDLVTVSVSDWYLRVAGQDVLRSQFSQLKRALGTPIRMEDAGGNTLHSALLW